VNGKPSALDQTANGVLAQAEMSAGASDVKPGPITPGKGRVEQLDDARRQTFDVVI
jgi:hypothetical protein